MYKIPELSNNLSQAYIWSDYNGCFREKSVLCIWSITVEMLFLRTFRSVCKRFNNCVLLLQDLAQYVNEVKRDNETLREIDQYQKSIENLVSTHLVLLLCFVFGLRPGGFLWQTVWDESSVCLFVESTPEELWTPKGRWRGTSQLSGQTSQTGQVSWWQTHWMTDQYRGLLRSKP